MKRRDFTAAACAALLAAGAGRAAAAPGGESALGVREALERGAVAAVARLGRSGGFLDDPQLRIPLPGVLEDAAGLLAAMGAQGRVEALRTAMNRAAEAAVAQARPLLVAAVRSMTLSATRRRIVTGGDTAATEFFRERTREPLAARFLPIVGRETRKVALAEKYDAVAGRAAALGLLRREDADLAGYVTGRALDALYLVIGEEERRIRARPGRHRQRDPRPRLRPDPVRAPPRGGARRWLSGRRVAARARPRAQRAGTAAGGARFAPRRALVAALVALAACSPPLDWRETRLDGGRLQALFPCKPTEAAREATLAGVRLRMSLHSCRADGSTFAVAHADVADPARVGPALAALREALAANLGAASAEAVPAAAADGLPAGAVRLRLRGTLPDGAVVDEQAVLVAAGTRVYQAAVLGAHARGEASDTFFASLRLPR